MDWREKALTGILLILLFLSLTFGPIWSMAFPILLGMIASAVTRAVEMMKTKPILPVCAPAPAVDAPVDAPALSVDAPVDAPAPAVDALALSVDARVDAPAISVDAPVDAPAPAVDASALSVDAPALSVDAPVDAPALAVDALALSVDAPVDASAPAPAVVAAGIKMRRKKKLVVKLNLHDDRDRSKAVQAVSDLGGIFSLTLDSKDNILRVSGDFHPGMVVNKLRQSWHTDIVSVGPAKEDDGNKDESLSSVLSSLTDRYEHRLL